MLKVDKATQTDKNQLRKKRTPRTQKQIKIIKPQEQKQDKQLYIKPLFNISFDE